MAESYTLIELESEPSEFKLRATYPNASPEFLFDCFTQPDLLAQWWVPQAEIEPHPGSSYRFVWAQMNWTLFGTLLNAERGKHLKFTWKWEHAPELPQRTVEILFEPSNAGTILSLTHGTYDDSPRDLEDRENHRTGWYHFLNALAQLEPRRLFVESEGP